MRVTQEGCRSLVDVLHLRAAVQGPQIAYSFLESDELHGPALTWSDLDRTSRAIAAAIASRVERGSRVLLLFPPGLDFVPAFFGVLAAGVIAVPSYPPMPGRGDRTALRLRGMLNDAGISLVFAPEAVREQTPALEQLVPGLRGLPWLTTEAVAGNGADGWSDPGCGPEDVALLQYTSGSTSTPRGVVVTHGNLLSNLAHAAELARHDGRTIAVSWLPVNHDMGLIDGVLQPAYSGFSVHLMSPAAFLQRPLRWLQAISRLRATHSGGPNFAYDLCVRRVGDEDRRSLDLSSWEVAFNGSEPVRHSTLEAFHRAFAGCGFRWNAFRPAYGLAESTLLVASSAKGEAPSTLAVNRAALAAGQVEPAGSAQNADILVSSGAVGGPSRISVVDPVSRTEVEPGRVGEIWVAGPSVASGYWNRPDDTAATFQAKVAGSSDDPFLRTGDLGFVHHGDLFITGRIKDVIVVRGLKHYPHDVELTAQAAHPAVRPGGCAAFAFPDADSCSIALLAEVDLRPASAADVSCRSVIEAIRRAVMTHHQLPLVALALLPQGTLPKTTSGKLQRSACRDAVIAGEIQPIARWSADPSLLDRAAS